MSLTFPTNLARRPHSLAKLNKLHAISGSRVGNTDRRTSGNLRTTPSSRSALRIGYRGDLLARDRGLAVKGPTQLGSQAEYAGSIPVIGSTLTSASAVRMVRKSPSVSRRSQLPENSIQRGPRSLECFTLRVRVEPHGQACVLMPDPGPRLIRVRTISLLVKAGGTQSIRVHQPTSEHGRRWRLACRPSRSLATASREAGSFLCAATDGACVTVQETTKATR